MTNDHRLFILPHVPTKLDQIIDNLKLPTYGEVLMCYIAYQLN